MPDPHRFSIYVNGTIGQTWTARAYDDETEQHVWSSEAASTLTQALGEIVAGIEEHMKAAPGA